MNSYRLSEIYLNKAKKDISRQTNDKKAKVALNRAIRINPKRSDAYAERGSLLIEKLSKKDAGFLAFQHALKLNPQDEQTLFYLLTVAGSFEVSNKIDDVILAYSILAQFYPGSIRLLSEFAGGLVNLKRNDEAIKAYKALAELNPKDASAFQILGDNLKAVERLDEAIIAYKAMREINPWNNYASMQLGKIFQSQNRLQEAITVYKTQLELNPDDFTPFKDLKQVANTLIMQQRIDEAMGIYKLLLKFSPHNAHVSKQLATLKSQKRMEMIQCALGFKFMGKYRILLLLSLVVMTLLLLYIFLV